MGISEIIDQISHGIGLGITIGIIALVVILLIVNVVIPIALMTWDNRDEIAKETEYLIEIAEDVTPEVLEAAQIYCELKLDPTELAQLRLNTIAPYMLNNVEPLHRMILENWRDTGEITACEIAILDENLDDYYKERLNLKSVTKSITGCNLVDCLSKYKVIENP